MLFLILLTIISAINLQNSNYIARGIYLDKFDPFPIAASSNQFASNVFNLNYNKVIRGACNINNITIPHGCSASCDNTLDFKSVITTTKSIEDIKAAYSESLGLSEELEFFVGSVSASVSNMISTTVYNKEVYNQVNAEIGTWILKCPLLGLELDQTFMMYVDRYPLYCNDSNWKECLYIIQNYGHAVFNQGMTLGGRFYQESYQTRTNYTTLQKKGVTVDATASFILADKIGAKFNGYVSQYEKDTYEALSEMQDIGQYGGNCYNCNWSEWGNTVALSPMVLQTNGLTMLYDLLTQLFDNNKTIALKAAALKQAIMYDLNNSYVCPNQCNGNGECVRNDKYNIGECNCTRGYTGYDCSIPQPALQGFYCGAFFNVSGKLSTNGSNPNKYKSYGCNNMKPWQCPAETELVIFDRYGQLNIYSCLLLVRKPYVYNGTICGYIAVGCMDMEYECPEGYFSYDIGSNQYPMCVLEYGNNVGDGILCGSLDNKHNCNNKPVAQNQCYCAVGFQTEILNGDEKCATATTICKD